ncbi:hypothetical protein OPT61_g7186 [Boeremia exigua]|uniref:Uncharacterized protein n=1 Tax=Boeremia exigua TaxID=749465 RepID=A0ACC2I3A2_9PLEO|nr:hypothetical protein OPT61_g7186 [Boeremia exigua]
MEGINAALAEIDSFEPGEQFSYIQIAKKYGVDRSTLARRHQRVQVPREEANQNQPKLTPQQEEELVKYIFELTACHSVPTRVMIQNFASAVAETPCSDRRAWEKGEVRQSNQDGNCEWVSLLACICADGTVLPPGVIFASKNSTIRARWVAEIDPETEPIHATSSPTGWTNNDIGLAWPTQVFDRTQTLQLLDVVCFKPLSSNYSKELSNYLQASQGLSPIGKPEFMHLFWPAWTNTFTKTLVLSAFRVTGISPPNADVVLDRFRHTSQSRSLLISSGTSAYSGDDWLKACLLLRAEVKDPRSRGARKLGQTIHHLSIQNELLNQEVAGLRATLHLQKKKKQQPNKQLQLPPNEEYAGGAMLWSPRAFQQARARLDEQAQKDRDEALKKAEMKELRAANKRYNDMIAEEKRVRRVREKEDRAKLQAVKAAEVAKRKAKKEHQKQAQDAEKSIQLPKTVKRKLLQPAAPRKKQNRGGVGGGSQPIAHERSPSPPTRTSTHGRKLKVPKRFR